MVNKEKLQHTNEYKNVDLLVSKFEQSVFCNEKYEENVEFNSLKQQSLAYHDEKVGLS